MDPIVSAALAKGAGKAAEESAGLMTRVLGPAADQIGAALGLYTEQRLKNIGRITEKARQKSHADDTAGQFPPRVAHRLLEDGSYCDDELMAEYLGGVLAGARTPTGRDDRAVSWASLIAAMSTLQLRAHFILYREWAVALHGRSDINLGLEAGRSQAEMTVDASEFLERLTGFDRELLDSNAMGHALHGLIRLRLLGDKWSTGPRELGNFRESPWEQLVGVSPTMDGIELYGWALGEVSMTSQGFTEGAKPFAQEEIPLMTKTHFANLLQVETDS